MAQWYDAAVDTPSRIVITEAGLLAGERYLQEYSEEFDNGTGEGMHAEFISALLSAVFHASQIAFEMPALPLRRPPQSDHATFLDS